MVDIGDIMKEIMRLHPNFSLKIGQANGSIMAEMRIADHKPALAMGNNLVAVLNQAHGEAVRNLADRLLAESRLSEAIFDNRVSALEEGNKGCCCTGCSGCQNEDDDDEYYEEYSEDFDDDNN
jgi:gamma-glutamyl:cysteine ligase YbdK (ATP-grasp superfamily)